MQLKTIFSYVIVFLLGILFSYIFIFLYQKTKIHKDYIYNIIPLGQFIQKKNTPNMSVFQVERYKTKYVLGIVTSFSKNVMIIQTKDSSNSRVVNITINDTTKFLSMVPKDSNVFQKEMKEFQNLSIDKKASSSPPKPFIDKEVSKDMFTIGKLVSIKSTDYIDSSSTSIIAESISLLPKISKATQ